MNQLYPIHRLSTMLLNAVTSLLAASIAALISDIEKLNTKNTFLKVAFVAIGCFVP